MADELRDVIEKLKVIGTPEPNREFQKQLGKVTQSRIALEKFVQQLERKQGPIRVVEVVVPSAPVTASIVIGATEGASLTSTETTNNTTQRL
jgi:hypothetical protein